MRSRPMTNGHAHLVNYMANYVVIVVVRILASASCAYNHKGYTHIA